MARCHFRGRGSKSGDSHSYTARRHVGPLAAYRTGSDLTWTLGKKLSEIGTRDLDLKADEEVRTRGPCRRATGGARTYRARTGTQERIEDIGRAIAGAFVLGGARTTKTCDHFRE